MDQEKWRIRTEEAMASMERMRQQPHSYEELVLNQHRNDKKAGRKNDFLLKSKKAREILATLEGRTLPGDAEREQTTVYPPRESEALPKVETYDNLYRVVTELINSKERQMETKYYAPQGTPLFLTVADHPGSLTDSDLVDNLIRMMVMNETEERERLDSEEAEKEIDAMSREHYRALRKTAQWYLYNEPRLQIYLEEHHVRPGLELHPIAEVLQEEGEPKLSETEALEMLRDALDEYSLAGMEIYLLESAVRE